MNDVSELVGAVEHFFPTEEQRIARAKTATTVANAQPTACQPTSAPPPADDIVILKKNDSYHVYFYPYALSDSGWFSSYIQAFTAWLRTLSASDTVYIYQTGDFYYMPWQVTAMTAIETCKAKTVFVVDSMIGAGSFLFACREFMILDTGAITVSRTIPADRPEGDAVYEPYFKALLAKAVERKLLTDEEVAAVFERDAVIFLTATEIRERTAS